MKKRFIETGIASMLSLFVTISAVMAEPSTNRLGRFAGFYAGGHLGFHQINTTGVFDGPEPVITPDLSNLSGSGANTGAHVGYNLQRFRFVAGLEVDATFGDFDTRYDTIQDGSAADAFLFTYPLVAKLNYLATVRGRLGYQIEAFDDKPILIFATAGIAFTKFEMDIADGRSKVGFSAIRPVVGAGLEMPLSKRWSLRGEYHWYAFSKKLDIQHENTSGIFDANDDNYVKLNDLHLARLGLSYALEK